ncbi:MAG: glucose 1-dehydrogenase [Chloroflexi bacterium]|nr:glucose 1-dehydrogenase [Chloroflexota bacterium]MBM4449596.1 glucose 1-dehydrogenase [Chloroflexota bacterium]
MVNLSRFSLEGKVALVTGASRGIGRATALGFADAGADVVIASRRQPDLEKVAEEIRAKGRKALPVAAHIGKIEEIRSLVDTAVAKFGKIDILVNNAAASPAMASPLDAEERLWDTIMNLNVKGVYFLSQAVAKIMKEHGGGKIINVSSVDAFKPEYRVGIYSIAKTAILMVTKSLALELAEYNIRVNAIAPGAVSTKLLDSHWFGMPEDVAKAQKDFLAKLTPMARVAEPDEMVGAMIFMASDASSYMTGSCIVVDGGQLLGTVPTVYEDMFKELFH